MRSAIHYPDVTIQSHATMRTALLMWDKLHVIVPFQELEPRYHSENMRQAWALIGAKMCPDEAQKRAAHDSISEMIADELGREFFLSPKANILTSFEEDQPFDEMWPQKLSNKTWHMLRRRGLTEPLDNGDFAFTPPAAQAIMAKLADACAGNVFARTTDRFLSYGLVAEQDDRSAAQMTVVPMTLSMIDASSVAFERLVDFRRREQTEAAGNHYTQMRHRYADRISAHISETKSIESTNQLKELRRQFEAEMEKDLGDLKEALRFNKKDIILSTTIISTVVGAGTYLAQNSLDTLMAAAMTAPVLAPTIEKLAALFNAGHSYSGAQCKVMLEHPMAYIYALSRA